MEVNKRKMRKSLRTTKEIKVELVKDWFIKTLSKVNIIMGTFLFQFLVLLCAENLRNGNPEPRFLHEVYYNISWNWKLLVGWDD